MSSKNRSKTMRNDSCKRDKMEFAKKYWKVCGQISGLPRLSPPWPPEKFSKAEFRSRTRLFIDIKLAAFIGWFIAEEPEGGRLWLCERQTEYNHLHWRFWQAMNAYGTKSQFKPNSSLLWMRSTRSKSIPWSGQLPCAPFCSLWLLPQLFLWRAWWALPGPALLHFCIAWRQKYIK